MKVQARVKGVSWVLTVLPTVPRWVSLETDTLQNDLFRTLEDVLSQASSGMLGLFVTCDRRLEMKDCEIRLKIVGSSGSEEKVIVVQAPFDLSRPEGVKVTRPQRVEVSGVAANTSSIDIKLAMEQMGDDKELFRRMLNLFVKNHSQAAAELRRAYSNGEFRHLGKLVHALKGVCGNIAATRLFERTKELDLVMKATGNEVSVGERGRILLLIDEIARELELVLGEAKEDPKF